MRSIEISLLDSLTALCTVGDPMNFGMALLMLHSGIEQAIIFMEVGMLVQQCIKKLQRYKNRQSKVNIAIPRRSGGGIQHSNNVDIDQTVTIIGGDDRALTIAQLLEALLHCHKTSTIELQIANRSQRFTLDHIASEKSSGKPQVITLHGDEKE